MYTALDPIGSSSKPNKTKTQAAQTEQTEQIEQAAQTEQAVDPLADIAEEKRKKDIQEYKKLKNDVEKVNSEISSYSDELKSTEKMLDKCITGEFANSVKSVMQNLEGQIENAMNALNVIGTKAAQKVENEGEPCTYNKQQPNSIPYNNRNGKTTFSCNTDELRKVLPQLQAFKKQIEKATSFISNLPKLEGCEDVVNVPKALDSIIKKASNAYNQIESMIERAEQAEKETERITEQLGREISTHSAKFGKFFESINKAAEKIKTEGVPIWKDGIEYTFKSNKVNVNGRDLHVNKESINEMLYSIDYAIHLADKYEINTEDKSDREILEELAIKFGVDEEKMSTYTDQELIEEIVNRHKTQLAQASGTDPLSENKGVEPTTEVETVPEPVTEVTTEVQLEPEPVTEPTIESITAEYKIQPEKPTEGFVEVCKIAMERGILPTKGEKETPSEFISRVAKELNIQTTTNGKPKDYETLIKEILDKNKDIDIDTDKDKPKPNGENPPQYPEQNLNDPSLNTGSVPTVDNELKLILKAAENFANETSSSNYICLVLNQAGYLTKEQLNEYKNYNIDDIFKKFDELGWKKITNIKNFQVGDVVLIDNNGEKIVQIYAGNNKWYIQGKSKTQELSSDYFDNLNWKAYRPQK